jgi:hypothetical protein
LDSTEEIEIVRLPMLFSLLNTRMFVYLTIYSARIRLDKTVLV